MREACLGKGNFDKKWEQWVENTQVALLFRERTQHMSMSWGKGKEQEAFKKLVEAKEGRKKV
jgi:hypothetical protein